MATTALAGHAGATPPSPAPWRHAWAAELLPPMVLITLGTVLLSAGHGLWFDELFTAEIARLPLADILHAAVSGEATASYLAGIPPSYNAPYYLVVHLWTALPGADGDTSLRVFSLLATAGGVGLVVRAVGRLAGRATGVLAGLALAANPLLLEQTVEARSYGPAVLATGAALLGLARWLQDPPRGLLLLGLAGAGMGLMHWYAVTVLVAFVAAALLLRGRRAVPVVLVGAAAAAPTALLVGMNLLNGTGGRNAEHLRDTGGTLADLAVEAWAGGRTPLLYLTVGLAVLGAVRGRGVRVLGACWVLVPLLLLLLAEQVRPVYLPRYLLAGLLGLGVLAAAGALAVPRGARSPVAALLVAFSLLAAAPLADREPREGSDRLVEALAAMHRAGEPVVGADLRSAMGLDHYVRTRAPALRADLLLPPDDAPPGADRVWLVRRQLPGGFSSTDDVDLLTAAGLSIDREWAFPGSKTDLVLQLWTR
ncbi:glycosyltransferase family 39 protein [Trujillonella endophytica]|uniref:Dolichyl-phosphate-mannose-protein mannosyltransferase n=1 Tax=Trujillonella endophytica TaxID=673521 RepID=A0A1H8P8F3_9ACTN|nr:glycosyltransferase family 39 protein [Trujillella endophytica]SEO38182.1 Dolichyl-phosphate-mannose-protein mannosyltransferase [Trujillella endophytica]